MFLHKGSNENSRVYKRTNGFGNSILPSHSDVILRALCDLDWAMCSDTKRSVSEYCTKSGGISCLMEDQEARDNI